MVRKKKVDAAPAQDPPRPQAGPIEFADKPVSVRLTVSEKTQMGQWKNASDVLTDASIIRRCLDYVIGLPQEEGFKVVLGEYSGEEEPKAKGYGELSEDIAWANHSYSKAYHLWSLNEWRNLLGSHTSPGLTRLVHAKSQYCLLFLAGEIRDAAIVNAARGPESDADGSGWSASYEAADRCLRAALIEGQKFIECKNPLGMREPSIDRTFMILYNSSCAYSVMSQYLVEATLPSWPARKNRPKGRDLIKQLAEAVGQDCFATDRVWGAIGDSWRKHITGPQAELVDECAWASLSYLEAIDWDNPRRYSNSFLDTSFIARRCSNDPDLTFMRCDDLQQRHDQFLERMLSSNPTLDFTDHMFDREELEAFKVVDASKLKGLKRKAGPSA